MLRRLLLCFALAATPGTAFACQCEDPAGFSAKDIEERAQLLANHDFVIAEVERLPATGPNDERYRVLRRLAGRPPDVIRAERFLTRLPDGTELVSPITSCDYSAPPGLKRVIAFSRGASPAGAPCSVLSAADADETMRLAGMCAQSDLEHPAVLKRVLELLDR